MEKRSRRGKHHRQLRRQIRLSGNDIVVADGDGIVFIKPSDAESLLEKVRGLMAGEAKSLKTIEEEGTLTRPWVMEKLQALGCEFFDMAE